MLALKPQVLAVVEHDADLLQAAAAAVVPEQPLLAVVDRVGLVARIVIPLLPAGSDDRIGRMALPFRDAIPAAGKADPRRGFILKSDVKHHIPLADLLDLASRHLVLLPRFVRERYEDRVALVLLPGQPVGARRITDRIRLVLFSAGIPHAEACGLFVPDHRWAHHGNVSFPRLIGGKRRLVAHPLPRNAVRTGRIANP